MQLSKSMRHIAPPENAKAPGGIALAMVAMEVGAMLLRPGLRRQAQHFAAAGCILCSPRASRTIRGMNESRTDRRKAGAARQAKLCDGTSRKLDRVLAELGEQREQLAALTELLGVELQRQVPTDPRR